MPAVKFEDLVKRASNKGIELKSREAMQWFRNNIRKVKPSESQLMKENQADLVNSWTNTTVGKFYFFSYDPKWKNDKNVLPYYDTFPLVIPIRYYKDGFLGLNFHYLPPALRLQLLGALYDLENNAKLDENKRIMVTYEILKNASKYAAFKPCIKRYLGKHIRSRFLRIPRNAWEMAIFLPLSNFVRASNKKVWQDSRKLIRG